MKARMHVVADDREKRCGVIAALRAMDDVTVSVRRLAQGDYLVDGRLLVERKTVRDFCVSLMDGRLFRQARRLAASKDRAVYIVEGAQTNAASFGVRRESLQGAILSLTVLFDLPLLRSTGPEETARLMGYVSRQMQRAGHIALPRAGYRPKNKRGRKLYILQGLPGIGPTRAMRLLDTFGSVEAVIGADEEELVEVSGISYGVARKIRQLVREDQVGWG